MREENHENNNFLLKLKYKIGKLFKPRVKVSESKLRK